MKNTRNFLCAALCGGAIVAAAPAAPAAHGHGVSVLYNPYVHEGELSAEVKGAYLIDEGGEDHDAWAGEATMGYGVTSFWQVEAGAELEGSDEEDTEISAIVVESKFQFAPKGAWIVDPGLKIEYARSLTGGPDEIIGKLLLAKDIGAFTHLANIGVAREIGDDAEDENEYGFGYGLSYAINDHLRLGGEWHSDFGNFDDDYDDQSHRIGPVAYGEIVHGVHYELGALIGVSDSAPDAEIKAAFEYEF